MPTQLTPETVERITREAEALVRLVHKLEPDDKLSFEDLSEIRAYISGATTEALKSVELVEQRNNYYEDKIDMLNRVGVEKDKMISELDRLIGVASKEIERLKRLLKYEIQCNTIGRMEHEGYRTKAESDKEVEKTWQQFKTENNL